MTFQNELPSDLKKILKEIELNGYQLCLVGGAVRDFLLNKTLSHDLDFEVRQKKIPELLLFLKQMGLKVEELPYEILRVKHGEFDLEFSTPRIETPMSGNMSHHHFKASLDDKLDYKTSFSRRDFTINAIGLELNFLNDSEQIIDPFGGCDDLKTRVLREISHYFFFDSVRFLRLLRFHLTLDFKISPSITGHLSSFDLTELPLYHFKEELRKSKWAGKFLALFKIYSLDNQLNLPATLNFFKEFDFDLQCKTDLDLLVDIFLKDKTQARIVSDFFSLPEKTLKSLASFDESYKNISSVKDLETIKNITSLSFLNLQDFSLLKDLKNLDDKKEWLTYYASHFLLDFTEASNITISSDVLEKLPKEKRSYYRYYLFLEKVAKGKKHA